MKLFKKIWPAKIDPHIPDRVIAISSPTEVTHQIHVVINRETNCFEGVPPVWRKQMEIIIGYVFFPHIEYENYLTSKYKTKNNNPILVRNL